MFCDDAASWWQRAKLQFSTSINFSRTRKLLQKTKSNASPLPCSLIFDPSSPFFFAIHFFLLSLCKPRLLFYSLQPNPTQQQRPTQQPTYIYTMADIDEPMEVDSQTTEVKAGKAKAGKDASGKKRFEVKKVHQRDPHISVYSSPCLSFVFAMATTGFSGIRRVEGFLGLDRFHRQGQNNKVLVPVGDDWEGRFLDGPAPHAIFFLLRGQCCMVTNTHTKKTSCIRILFLRSNVDNRQHNSLLLLLHQAKVQQESVRNKRHRSSVLSPLYFLCSSGLIVMTFAEDALSGTITNRYLPAEKRGLTTSFAFVYCFTKSFQWNAVALWAWGMSPLNNFCVFDTCHRVPCCAADHVMTVPHTRLLILTFLHPFALLFIL